MFGFLGPICVALGISPGKILLIAAVILALVAGGLLAFHNIRQSGIDAAELDIAKRGAAAMHEADVTSRAVDDDVARTADPVAELRKKGWIIDAK